MKKLKLPEIIDLSDFAKISSKVDTQLYDLLLSIPDTKKIIEENQDDMLKLEALLYEWIELNQHKFDVIVAYKG